MKKKILILGVNGMAGHRIYEYLNSLGKYDIWITGRKRSFFKDTFIFDILKDLNHLKIWIDIIRPDIIINCIGMLIKSCEENPDKAVYVNSYFPHWLESLTKNTKTKIIHLSTDCVFDGKVGYYREHENTTGKGVYAKSKALGEVINNKDLTLRMSIIGDELKDNGSGLFEWFMRQKGNINGFFLYFWSGITTLELAKQIDKIIDTELTGLYHLAYNDCISKCDLLDKIRTIWNKKDIHIVPSHNVEIDKTLHNTRMKEYDPKIPSYDIQLQEMKDWIERKK